MKAIDGWRLGLFWIALGASWLGAGSLQAQSNYTWLGDTAFLGSTYWSTNAASPNWNTNGVVWLNGANAIFGSTTFTKAVQIGSTDVTANAISFTDNGYTIDRSGAFSTGSLTISGTTNQIAVSSGVSAAMSTPFTVQNAFTYAGPGTLTLSGAVTVSGNAATTVSAGTLALSGGGTLSSQVVSVASGATFNVSAVTGGYAVAATKVLAGSGSVVGPVTVNSGGILRPGNATSVGTLSLSGTTTLAAGAQLDINLASAASADLVSVSGNLNVGTLNLNLNKLAGSYSATQTYTIVSSTALTTSGLTLPANFTFTGSSGTVGGVTFNPSGFTSGDKFTLGKSGNSLVLTYTPVPEPVLTIALLLGGLGLRPGLRRWRMACGSCRSPQQAI